MQNGNLGFGGMRWRSLMVAAVAVIGTLWTSVAMATITQGDFSVFGFFETREAGHWGEGSSSSGRDADEDRSYRRATSSRFPARRSGEPAAVSISIIGIWPRRANWRIYGPTTTWSRTTSCLGRFDTLLIKDADFFAFYRPWYDAVGTLKNIGRQTPNTDAIPYSHSQSTDNGILPRHSLQNEYFKNDLREYYGQLNFHRQLLRTYRQAAGHLVGSRRAVRNRSHQSG